MKYLNLKYTPLFLLVSLFSCTSKEVSSDKKIFRYNEVGSISSLDPAFGSNLSNVWAVTQLYNSPLSFNEKMEVEPSLAKSWEISEDGKTYTFTVRDDVVFHDHKIFKGGVGRKCTAKDLEYTLRRVCDTTSVYNQGIWIFKDKVLRNNKGQLSDTCFIATNDTTLKVYLDHPVPYFLQILCMPFCYVVPHEIAEHYGEDFGRNPVGTGPFKFDTWDEGNTLVFTKNEKYWRKDEKGKSLPYLDAVEVSFISDPTQSFRAFQLGYFDFESRLNEAVLDEVLYPDGSVREDIQSKFKIFKGPYLATDFLGFQLDAKSEVYAKDQNSPFLNADFRKALSYAVDRKRIVALLRNGLGIVGENGVVPKAMPYYDASKVKGYHFDPNMAQEHLKKSGFKASELKGLKITLAKQNQALAEFLTKTWKEVLGVDIAIDLNEGKVCLDLAETGRINFFKMGWLADYPEGENYLTLFYGPNFAPTGPNRAHYKNSRFDALYKSSIKVENPLERGAIYQEMDSILMEECPIIALYYGQILAVINPRVKDFRLDPMNTLNLERVDFQ